MTYIERDGGKEGGWEGEKSIGSHNPSNEDYTYFALPSHSESLLTATKSLPQTRIPNHMTSACCGTEAHMYGTASP